jgi:hypothetical protein
MAESYVSANMVAVWRPKSIAPTEVAALIAHTVFETARVAVGSGLVTRGRLVEQNRLGL